MLYNLTKNKMKIIKVDDINWVQPSIYEVICNWRLVFASQSADECWEYIKKWSFLFE
mgnify:CR=1 FL=1